MREAMTRRPLAVAPADRIAGAFLLVVIALAAAAALAWWPVDPARALAVATSVLIVTCPCALSLAAPAAQLAALSALAKRGVLLRRIGALEVLARVNHLMLDKTGTLTDPRSDPRSDPGNDKLTDTRPTLQLRPLPDAGLADFEACVNRAASLAALSSHPLSRALAAAHRPAQAVTWRDVHEVPGLGIEAIDEAGFCWRLGAPRWWPSSAAVDAAALFGRCWRFNSKKHCARMRNRPSVICSCKACR
jgi:Cu2+-exporting ATPase